MGIFDVDEAELQEREATEAEARVAHAAAVAKRFNTVLSDLKATRYDEVVFEPSAGGLLLTGALFVERAERIVCELEELAASRRRH